MHIAHCGMSDGNGGNGQVIEWAGDRGVNGE